MSNYTIQPLSMKFKDADLEFDFQIDYLNEIDDDPNIIKQEVKEKLGEVNEFLSINNERIEVINRDIDKFTNHADGLDYTIAVCSGIIAGIIDSLWVGEFKMERGKAWSNHTVNDFVMKTAKSQGYKGDRLEGAISHLENKFKIPSDNLWKGKNVGISAKSHHLDDLAHHPTPIGLFFSIMTQFTKKGSFQNSEGTFLPISIDEDGEKLIGNNVFTKIFAGTINWFFHLVSDMSGSSKTAGLGMGIPGPIVSLMKELSMIPGLNKSGLSKKIKDVFVRERFDLRSELAVVHELGRQAVPVIINEIIVRSFYFIRRIHMEYKEKGSFKEIEWKKTLPWKNRTIIRMLTISTGTFTAIDMVDAAIRGAVKSGGNPAAFATEVLLRVNFVGVGRFAIAITTDISMGVKRDKLRNERLGLISQQLHLMNAKVSLFQADMWISADMTEKTINESLEMMEKVALIHSEAWNENIKSLQNIGEYSEGIKEKNSDVISNICDILTWG